MVFCGPHSNSQGCLRRLKPFSVDLVGDFEICSNVREISDLSFDDRFHCIFFQPRYQGFSLEGKSPGNEVDILQFVWRSK